MLKELRMPDIYELAGLTRWAQVLFAARCADRLEPYVQIDSRTSTRTVQAVRTALFVAYEAAAGAGLGTSWRHANRARLAAVIAGRHLSALSGPHKWVTENGPGQRAAFAAAHAADAASAAIDAQAVAAPTGGADHIAYAAAELGAWVVLYGVGSGSVHWAAYHRQARHDFWLLTKRAEKGSWTHQTPVPAEACGPLWHEGPPDGWPCCSVAG